MGGDQNLRDAAIVRPTAVVGHRSHVRRHSFDMGVFINQCCERSSRFFCLYPHLWHSGDTLVEKCQMNLLGQEGSLEQLPHCESMGPYSNHDMKRLHGV